MKKVRGCYDEGTNVTLLGDEKLTRCPLILVRDHALEFYKLSGMWGMMQKGFLPEAGGIDDQQAKIMAALMVYDRAVNETKAVIRGKGKGDGAGEGSAPSNSKRRRRR